jgi:hypothetical protein
MPLFVRYRQERCKKPAERVVEGRHSKFIGAPLRCARACGARNSAAAEILSKSLEMCRYLR